MATERAGRPPGPRGLDVPWTLLALRDDPLGALLEVRRKHGDLAYLPLLHRGFFLATHPRHVDHVLRSSADRYRKGTRSYAKIRALLGDGLVTSEGDKWRRHRALIQPALHPQRIAGFRSIVAALTDETLEGWREPAARGEPIAIDREMRRLTLRIVGRALFGREIGVGAGSLGAAIDTALRFTARRVEGLVDPGWMPTPARRRFHKALTRLDRTVHRLLEEPRPPGTDAGNLLSMLVEAREAGDRSMTDDELRDQVLTLLLAGHETTAAALTWTLHRLGRHPGVQDRVREEAAAGPVVPDLRELAYTRTVVQESMRLFPPVWMIERRAAVEDTIDGYRIPAGSVIALSQYVTHRHPAFWPDPERFDPDRFRADQSARRPRSAYFPFGAGPRTCVGAGFATMETVLIVAMVTGRYRLESAPGPDPEPRPGITLRPSGPLPLQVRPV